MRTTPEIREKIVADYQRGMKWRDIAAKYEISLRTVSKVLNKSGNVGGTTVLTKSFRVTGAEAEWLNKQEDIDAVITALIREHLGIEDPFSTIADSRVISDIANSRVSLVEMLPEDGETRELMEPKIVYSDFEGLKLTATVTDKQGEVICMQFVSSGDEPLDRKIINAMADNMHIAISTVRVTGTDGLE